MRTARLYWTLSKGHRKLLALGVLGVLGVDLLGLLPPIVLGLLVERAEGRSRTASPFLLAAAYVGVVLLQALIRYPMRAGFSGASARITAGLRERYASHLLAVSSENLAGRPTGDLMSRATNDLAAVEGALSGGLLFLFDCVFYLIALPAAMVLISPALSLWVLLPAALVPLFAGRQVSRIAEGSARAQLARGRLAHAALENVSALQTVRAFGLEDHEVARFGKASEQSCSMNVALGWLEAGFSPGIQVLMALGTSVVLECAGLKAARKSLSPGQFVAFIQYFGMLAWPLMGLSWAFLYFRKGEVSLRRIDEILSLPASSPVPAEPLPKVRGALDIRHLTYRYPGAREAALSDLSFSVRPGEKIAILGPAGSGKSTLIHLLARLIEPPLGTIFLDSRDIRTMNAEDLRLEMAVSPQQPFLFSGTLRENILLGRAGNTGPDGIERASWEASRLTEDQLPEGLETYISGKGANLSGGQRQRAALARALVRCGPILIIDDAFSALDDGTESEIFRGLSAPSESRTLIFVTHRIKRASAADRILVLGQGRLLEQGRPGDLVKSGGYTSALAGRQEFREAFDAPGNSS